MSMKLVYPKFLLNCDAVVFVSKRDENGKPINEVIYEGRARHDQKSRTTMNAQREIIRLSGTVVIPDEVQIPTDDAHPLKVKINDRKEYTVYSTNIPLNPDQSVFSTEFFLI